MPFCNLRLAGRRPQVLPKGYPTEPRTIGEHIRRCRLDRGLTQRTLGQKLGVRSESVAAWESARSRPQDRHWPTLLSLLGEDLLPDGETPVARLEASRRRLGLSRKAFAARVGLDEGSICRWVRGGRQPSPWMAGRIEAILSELQGGPPTAGTESSYFDLTRWRRTPPPGVIPVTLGERLRARRLRLGLSQTEVGRLVGVSRSAVQRWESSQCDPTPTRGRVLRRVLSRRQR